MYEIFISYCTDDNAALAWEKLGWVDIFHDSLNKRLNVYCGRRRRPTIWYDSSRIEGNQLLTYTIDAALKQAVLLIPVISPSYVTSDWCRKELTGFFETKAAAGDPDPGGRSRVLKTVKIPVEDETFLKSVPELAECRGYNFFRVIEGGPPSELNPLRNPADSSEFTDTIDKLAKSVLDTLGILARSTHTGQTIFLAETSRDMLADTDQLRKEMEMFGHTVVRPPSAPFPDDEDDYRTTLRGILAQCRASIHPVGKFYGTVPEGYDFSPIATQYDVAAEEARGRVQFSQLSWMSSAIEPKDERQQNFIRRLERQGPQFHRMSLEDFKTRVRDVLTPDPVPLSRPAPTAGEIGGIETVYLICDQRDREENIRVVEDLLRQHYGVVRSLLEREVHELREKHKDDLEAAVRADHQENLASCDAVLIYHGEGDQLWLRQKFRELRSARGYGRQRPFTVQAVLIAPPRTSDKKPFDTNGVLTLAAFNELKPSVLDPFYQAMMRGRERAVF
jgi:hypothetical protein